jgi:hypothetical protein
VKAGTCQMAHSCKPFFVSQDPTPQCRKWTSWGSKSSPPAENVEAQARGHPRGRLRSKDAVCAGTASEAQVSAGPPIYIKRTYMRTYMPMRNFSTLKRAPPKQLELIGRPSNPFTSMPSCGEEPHASLRNLWESLNHFGWSFIDRRRKGLLLSV